LKEGFAEADITVTTNVISFWSDQIMKDEEIIQLIKCRNRKEREARLTAPFAKLQRSKAGRARLIDN